MTKLMSYANRKNICNITANTPWKINLFSLTHLKDIPYKCTKIGYSYIEVQQKKMSLYIVYTYMCIYINVCYILCIHCHIAHRFGHYCKIEIL